MTPESQRIAIAEACGHVMDKPEEFPSVAIHNGQRYGIPDYLNDLNAMHEAEEVLHPDYTHNANYTEALKRLVGKVKHSGCSLEFAMLNATAAQRAEAFLRTLGLWKD